ncbi:MAG TPA: C69 family dipeptidase [candidate division Zixibacteria bacterium]|nr:C69 family dipeptidase [candidate division Zixibacteria bacterium]
MDNRSVINLVTLFLVLFAAGSASATGCFSVIVGKDASANGCVMVGHTEDISPAQPIAMVKISDEIPYVDKIISETLLYPPASQRKRMATLVSGEEFCDCILNDFGVTVASDQCPSVEDKPELVNGGIGRGLRHIVTARAVSAREGVHIAGAVVEKVGYNSNGRTYIICDPDEGWVFCPIGGKHWLAHRVADDEVAVVANSFTVREIDLDDTLQFLASEGLIEYAVERGWYDQENDGAFDFSKTFADSAVAAGSFNVCRQWRGLDLLSTDRIKADWGNLPFSVKPGRKIGVSDITTVLQDHYENTQLYIVPSDSSSPHTNRFMTICSGISQMSFVAELRTDRPKDIGFVFWLCLGQPCTSFYIPFYFGIGEIPEPYLIPADDSTSNLADRKESIPSSFGENEAFATFSEYCGYVDSNYTTAAPQAKRVLETYYDRMLPEKEAVELQATKSYRSDSLQVNEELREFTLRQIGLAFDLLHRVMAH